MITEAVQHGAAFMSLVQLWADSRFTCVLPAARSCMQHAIPDSFISSSSAVGSTAEHSSADIFYRMPVPHHPPQLAPAARTSISKTGSPLHWKTGGCSRKKKTIVDLDGGPMCNSSNAIFYDALTLTRNAQYLIRPVSVRVS